MRRELIQVSLPSASPAGSTKACFVDVEAGTVADLIKTLLQEDGKEITEELGCVAADDEGGNEDNWGLQRVILSEPNRRWSDEELLALDETTGGRTLAYIPDLLAMLLIVLPSCVYRLSPAILDKHTLLSTVLPQPEEDASTNTSNVQERQRPPSRNFSDFTLTAHLQVPLIRLVYLPYRVDIAFTHVPEIPEDFKLAWYVGGHMTVAQTIDAVLDELGVRKIVTQGSKSARVEYQIAVGSEGELIHFSGIDLTHCC